MQLSRYKCIRLAVTVTDKCIIPDRFFIFDQFIGLFKRISVHKVKLSIHNISTGIPLNLIEYKCRITGCGKLCTPSGSLKIMFRIFLMKFQSSLLYKELNLRAHCITHHPDFPVFWKLLVLVTIYMPVILFKELCLIGVRSAGCIQLHIVSCMRCLTFSIFRLFRMHFITSIILKNNQACSYQLIQAIIPFPKTICPYDHRLLSCSSHLATPAYLISKQPS